MLKHLKKIYLSTPIIPSIWRGLKKIVQNDPLVTTLYTRVFENGKLSLDWVCPETLCPPTDSILFPVQYPLHAGEDAPLADMLFLLNLAKGRKARRILEVGTYRARTTYAFYMNCPEAEITSYDIQNLKSKYRDMLMLEPRVSLRLESFQEAEEKLKREKQYDFIFIDGSHKVEDVVRDSLLAFKIVANGGVIIWHDYRKNGYLTELLKVPEGLARLSQKEHIRGVKGTTCAIYEKKSPTN
jgi:predicted O-methyltransferase YrrM